jgi:hypothetical protein
MCIKGAFAGFGMVLLGCIVGPPVIFLRLCTQKLTIGRWAILDQPSRGFANLEAFAWYLAWSWKFWLFLTVMFWLGWLFANRGTLLGR